MEPVGILKGWRKNVRMPRATAKRHEQDFDVLTEDRIGMRFKPFVRNLFQARHLLFQGLAVRARRDGCLHARQRRLHGADGRWCEDVALGIEDFAHMLAHGAGRADGFRYEPVQVHRVRRLNVKTSPGDKAILEYQAFNTSMNAS